MLSRSVISCLYLYSLALPFFEPFKPLFLNSGTFTADSLSLFPTLSVTLIPYNQASNEALESRIKEAEGFRTEAESTSARSAEAEREARARADGLTADKRVLQETLAAMRLECTERWVSQHIHHSSTPFIHPYQ